MPEKLTEPLRWRTPRMIFVNSMSDLFQEDVPDDYIVSVARVMQLANWHTYQVLTKRSERMRNILQTKLDFAATQPHIWWGVSVENKKHGLERIVQLQSSPAGVRFLSIEPLLEDLGSLTLTGISWVIVGGESGTGARPMRKSWVLSIRNQCRKAKVPFFFKQWGGVRKSETGRSLDGKTYDEFPRRTELPVMDYRVRQDRTRNPAFTINAVDAVPVSFPSWPTPQNNVRRLSSRPTPDPSRSIHSAHDSRAQED